MLEPRKRKVQLSLTERVRRGDDIGIPTDTDADYICKKCLDDNVISWTYVKEGELRCVICSKIEQKIHRSALEQIPEFRGTYERELVERLRKENDMSTALTTRSVDDERKLALFTQERVSEEKANMIKSMIVPAQITDPIEREAAALILADFKVNWGLNAFVGEIYIMPLGKDKWAATIGYKGYGKIARRQDAKLGTKHILGKRKILSEAEIVEDGANRCSLCGGIGVVGKNKTKCWECDGKGEFDSKDVVAVKVPLYIVEEKIMADEAGIEYEPTWGLGVWQKGPSNIAKSKSPAWGAYKNAVKDAIRQKYSLDDMDVGGYNVSIIDAGEHKDPNIIEGEATIVDEKYDKLDSAIEASGVQYDNKGTFMKWLKNRLSASDLFDDYAEILTIMNELELSYSIEDERVLQLKVGGYKMDYYPLSRNVFLRLVKDKPIDGVLKMLIELDFKNAAESSVTIYEKEIKTLIPAQASNLCWVLSRKKPNSENKKKALEAVELGEMLEW